MVLDNIVNVLYGTWDYVTSAVRSIFLFNLLPTFINGTPSLLQYRLLWSFKLGDTQLDRFLAKNEQVQRKLQYFLKCNNGQTKLDF